MQLHSTDQRDVLQDRIVRLASELSFETLPADVSEAALGRVIDTFGAAFAGSQSGAAQSARAYAAAFPIANGATVFGTRQKTTPEIAAFVNATTSREAEWNDVYMSRRAGGTHPSDAILPILAAAEYAGASGSDFLAAVVAAYEIYLELADRVAITGFDMAGIAAMSVAAGAGRVLGLSPDQLRHSIAICVVSHNPINQARRNQLTMWKAAAAGQAGRAGVSAALMARAGLSGANLPFEGTAGWNNNVARNKYEIPALDPVSDHFRIRDTLIKWRASCAVTIPSIMAAEDAARQVEAENIERIVVETYAYAKNGVGSGEQRWNPSSRESADHSIPYVVAAALMFGSVGPRQFEDDCLWNPDLRALIQKVEVTENPDFTEAYATTPRQHPTRVNVFTRQGAHIVGNTGAPDHEDMGTPRPYRAIEQKFRELASAQIETQEVEALLATLRRIPQMGNIRELSEHLPGFC